MLETRNNRKCPSCAKAFPRGRVVEASLRVPFLHLREEWEDSQLGEILIAIHLPIIFHSVIKSRDSQKIE